MMQVYTCGMKTHRRSDASDQERNTDEFDY